MIALALGVLGLVLSLGQSKFRSLLAAITAAAGAVVLIILMIDVKKQLKTDKATDTGGSGYNLDDIKITAEFTPWFYLAVVLFIVAAIISWQRSKKKA